MPLNEGAISEILPFAPEGTDIAAGLGDLMPLAEYLGHAMRLKGNQPGLALRGLNNRALRQSAFIAAVIAQFVANRHAPGVVDDGDIDAVEAGLVAAINALIAEAAPDLAGYLRASVNATLSAGYYVTPLALEITGGAVTPVLVNRNVQTLAVDEAITLANPATIPPGGMAVIYATQDASGGHGITWGSAYRICNGGWSTDPDAVNILWLTTAGGGIIDVAIAQRGEG